MRDLFDDIWDWAAEDHYETHFSPMDVSWETVNNPVNGWVQRRPWESRYHGPGNVKYTHPNGREAIFNLRTQELVTDPRYMGTYNLVGGTEWYDYPFHMALDVVPYWVFGNSPDDTTRRWQRVFGQGPGQ